ncbi:MAG: DUF6785 family protein [Thermoproteota archaeon]
MAVEKLPRGFTPRVIILGLFFIAISMPFNRMICGLTGIRGFLPPPIFLVIFLISVFSYYTKKFRFTPQEYTVLYLIGFAGTASVFMHRPYLDFGIGNQIGQFLSPVNFMAMHASWSPALKGLIPSLLNPGDQAFRSIWFGGPIDWTAWAIPVAFWMIYLFAFVCWSLFLALLTRKQFIEMEGLPFPGAMPYEMVITLATVPESGDKPTLLKKEGRFFWLGFAIGLILSIPQLYAYFAPVPPFFYGVMGLDLTPYLGTILPGAHLNITFAWHIYFFMVSFLFNVDVLASALLAWLIVGLIYPVIAVSQGWAPLYPGGSPYQYGWNVGPFKYNWVLFLGLILGMGATSLYLGRSHYMETIRSAFFGKKLPEEETGIPYRTIWAGLILTTIIIIGAYVALGTPIHIALLIIVFAVLYWVAFIKMEGESEVAVWYGGLASPMGVLFWDIGQVTGAWTIDTRNSMAHVATRFSLWTQFNSQGPARIALNPGLATIQMKVGDYTKTDLKDVIKSMILAIGVMVPVSFVLYLWWTHAWGLSALTGSEMDWITGNSGASFINEQTVTTPYALGQGDHWIYTIMGFILAVVLMMARMKFPWFWINPVGVATGVIFMNMITLIALAFIVKYLTLKLGGAKAHDNILVPAVVGIMSSVSIVIFTLFTMRFFVEAWPRIVTKFFP